MTQEGIVKAREERDDGEIIQERKIAADDEKDLERDKKDTRDMSCLPRSKRKPCHDQFDEVVPCRLKFVEPKWRELQIATDRVRVASEDNKRESKADPGEDRQWGVGNSKPEECGHS